MSLILAKTLRLDRGDRVWLSIGCHTQLFFSILQPCAIITLMLNHVSLPLCLPDIV